MVFATAATAGTLSLLFGYFAPTMAWGIPHRLVPRRARRNASLFAALLGASIALATTPLLGTTGAEESFVLAGAGLTGVLVAATVVFARARRNRLLEAAASLALAHRHPERREAVVRAIDELCARLRRRPQHRATLLLALAGPLTRAGLWERMASWLEAIEPSSIPPSQRALRAQAIAACRLHLGELERAEAALSDVAGVSADRATERWLLLSAALLASVRGDAEEAQRLIGGLVGEERDPAITGTLRIIRAHVHASRHRSDLALEELRRLRESEGPCALLRAERPAGPASALAEEVRAEGRAGTTRASA